MLPDRSGTLALEADSMTIRSPSGSFEVNQNGDRLTVDADGIGSVLDLFDLMTPARRQLIRRTLRLSRLLATEIDVRVAGLRVARLRPGVRGSWSGRALGYDGLEVGASVLPLLALSKLRAWNRRVLRGTSRDGAS